MNFNQELNLNLIKTVDPQTGGKYLAYGLSILLLLITLWTSFTAYKKITSPPPALPGGGIVNQAQINQALDLLQEKTIRFSN